MNETRKGFAILDRIQEEECLKREWLSDEAKSFIEDKISRINSILAGNITDPKNARLLETYRNRANKLL